MKLEIFIRRPIIREVLRHWFSFLQGNPKRSMIGASPFTTLFWDFRGDTRWEMAEFLFSRAANGRKANMEDPGCAQPQRCQGQAVHSGRFARCLVLRPGADCLCDAHRRPENGRLRKMGSGELRGIAGLPRGRSSPQRPSRHRGPLWRGPAPGPTRAQASGAKHRVQPRGKGRNADDRVDKKLTAKHRHYIAGNAQALDLPGSGAFRLHRPDWLTVLTVLSLVACTNFHAWAAIS